MVLGVREAPLNAIHLENMLQLARMGVVISPPVPSFHARPESIDDLVSHTASRILDLFEIHVDVSERWRGFEGGEGE